MLLIQITVAVSPSDRSDFRLVQDRSLGSFRKPRFDSNRISFLNAERQVMIGRLANVVQRWNASFGRHCDALVDTFLVAIL